MDGCSSPGTQRVISVPPPTHTHMPALINLTFFPNLLKRLAESGKKKKTTCSGRQEATVAETRSAEGLVQPEGEDAERGAWEGTADGGTCCGWGDGRAADGGTCRGWGDAPRMGERGRELWIFPAHICQGNFKTAVFTCSTRDKLQEPDAKNHARQQNRKKD